MSDKTERLRLRQVRNQLVDILCLGKTWPLSDVTLTPASQMVPFGQPAKIVLDPGAPDVQYTLHGPRREDLGLDAVPGSGAATTLCSAPIEEDLRFTIEAVKTGSGLEVWLDAHAEVRVGLDATLPVEIMGADLEGDLKVVDFGGAVEVEVVDAQEGVLYSLVELPNEAASLAHELPPPGDDAVRSVDDVVGKGPGHTIRLQSKPFTDDALLAVVATKRFDIGRADEKALLRIRLPLAVRPDSTVELRLDPSALVDWNGATAWVVGGAQAGVEYRAFARPLKDADFLYDEPLPADAVTVEVPSADLVRILRPPVGDPWAEDPAAAHPGLQLLGEPVAGDGGDLTRPWSDIQEDSVAVVQVRKRHVFPKPQGVIEGLSALELPGAVVVLPKPDPAVELMAQAVDGAGAEGPWLISGGRPGVFYTPLDDQGQALGRPVYFQRPDEAGAGTRGLGTLRLGQDFVVARDPLPDSELPASTHPVLVLDGELPGTSLVIRASWARTRVAGMLSEPLVLPAPTEAPVEDGPL